MWRAEANFRIVIGALRVHCLREAGRGAKTRWERLSSQPIADMSEAALCAALDAVTQRPASVASGKVSRRGHLRVLVSDRWAPLINAPWNAALGDAGAPACLATQFEAVGIVGEPADEFRFARPGHMQACVAVRYPAWLMRALEQAAGSLAVRLSSVRPLAAAGWTLARGTSKDASPWHALALVDERRVGLFMSAPQSPGWMPGQVLDPVAGDAEEAAANLWAREGLRRPMRAQQALRTLDLRLDAVRDAAESTDGLGALLDAAQRADPRGAALDAMPATLSPRWALAAAAALVVAVLAGWQAWHGLQTLESQRTALAERQAARAPAPARQWTVDERARVRAVNAAIRELNLPLAALAEAMLPPKDIAVAMVTLDIAPSKGASTGRPTLSVTADAASAVDMTRYLAFLSARPTITVPVLIGHEILETDPARPYRFTVEMSWRQ